MVGYGQILPLVLVIFYRFVGLNLSENIEIVRLDIFCDYSDLK
jgi:hypothetical membrane protein